MATEAEVAAGTIVIFNGYGQLEEDQEEFLKAGDRLKVEVVNDDGGLVVARVDDVNVRDTVFPEEVTVAPAEEAAATPAASKPATKPRKAKAAAVAAEVAPVPAEVAAAETVEVVEAPAAVEPAKVAKVRKNAKTKAVEAAPVEAAPAAAPVKAAPVKAAPAAKVEPAAEAGEVVVAFTDSAAVAAMLGENDALDAAKSLMQQTEEAFFSLGGVLAHVYGEGLHKTLKNDDDTLKYDGKRGFADYMETELNLQYRKGMTLIEIYTAFRQLGIDERRLAEIGWTKARHLTKIASKDNFDELIDYAKDHSREELVEHVKETKVKAGIGEEEGQTSKKTKLTFNLFDDQAETVQRALGAAKEKVGVGATPEQALQMITAEWSGLTESIEVPLEDAIAALELRYGVGLAIVAEGDDTNETEGQTVNA
jgi:hypothetical protein